nr:hypothetical protein [Tanacetum cinerariifolium]
AVHHRRDLAAPGAPGRYRRQDHHAATLAGGERVAHRRGCRRRYRVAQRRDARRAQHSRRDEHRPGQASAVVPQERRR